jgi:hypothetical protein
MSRFIAITCVTVAAVVALAAAGGPGDPSGGTSGAERGDRDYVLALYRGLLGRDPRPSEMEATLRALGAASHRVMVHNRLLDSREFSKRVPDDAFLVGLVSRTRGRAPLLHEMLVGRHYLREGVPRSELFGHLTQPRPQARGVTRLPAGIDDTIRLDFSDRNLDRYTRLAETYEAEPEAIRSRLLGEAEALGGLEPGSPVAPSPEGGSDPRYNVYYGYLHAHTRVSLDALLQGSPGPFEAFDYARTVAGLDFLGLSDHGEFMSTWPWNDEWGLLQTAVDASNEDGVFVALRGFEYSNPLYGHINVFGTDDFTSTWSDLTLRRFYDWLALHPEAASTFNHPGAYESLGLEFLHYRFFPGVERQMMGIELLTHDDQYDKYSVGYVAADGHGHMDEAIQSGWRIASVSAQDNHRGGWGTIDEYRTGVLALSLTQEAILDAVRHRRFFSTQDRNLVMSFRTRNREMGSLVGPGGGVFIVSLGDGDGEGFRRIDLYENGVLFESRDVSGARAWEFTVPARVSPSWYYALVTQDDGDQAMSAPIWVAGSPGG